MGQIRKLPRKTAHVTVKSVIDPRATDLRDGDDLHLVNGRTGEDIESWTHDSRAAPDGKDWIRLFQVVASRMARDKRMTPIAMKLWLEILGKAGFGNALRINHTALAADLDVSRESISRAASLLVKIGAVERMSGEKQAYRLNPNDAWKGKREWQHGRAKGWSEKRAKLTVKDDSNADQLPHHGAEVCHP